MSELIHIGYENFLDMDRVVALIPPKSAPTKRSIKAARERGVLIDMTNGRKARVAVFADTGHIILIALASETLVGRLNANRKYLQKED